MFYKMFIGYIYKITGSCGKVYVGSTSNFKKRKNFHTYATSKTNKSSSRKLEKPLVFEIIREDMYKLIKTMYLVEQYYIDNIDCVNETRAFKLDKEKAKKKQKEYRETHREEIKKHMKKYWTIKNECIYCKKIVSKIRLSRHHKTKRCLAIQESLKALVNI